MHPLLIVFFDFFFMQSHSFFQNSTIFIHLPPLNHLKSTVSVVAILQVLDASAIYGEWASEMQITSGKRWAISDYV